MKVLIIVLIILAVLLVAGLLWMAMKRKKDQRARTHAGELRSEAAETTREKELRAARAREAEAEAEKARAQAEQAQVKARDERVAADQTQAQQEHHLREADRIDPDVDHKSKDYQPGPGTAGAAGAGAAGAGAAGSGGSGTGGSHAGTDPDTGAPADQPPHTATQGTAPADDQQGWDSESGERRTWSDDGPGAGTAETDDRGRHQR